MNKQSGPVDELKPCPFCNGSAVRVDIDEAVGATKEDENYGGSFIECDRCGACTRVHFDRKENLSDAWNRRSLPAPLSGRGDEGLGSSAAGADQ